MKWRRRRRKRRKQNEKKHTKQHVNGLNSFTDYYDCYYPTESKYLRLAKINSCNYRRIYCYTIRNILRSDFYSMFSSFFFHLFMLFIFILCFYTFTLTSCSILFFLFIFHFFPYSIFWCFVYIMSVSEWVSMCMRLHRLEFRLIKMSSVDWRWQWTVHELSTQALSCAW